MLRIEIIGKEGGFLDVKPGTNSPFTISAQEIRRPAEKKGTFSKTVTLAETKNNGEKLGFLFGIDVINGGFDVNKRVNVRLFNGETEIEGNFFLQLTKIKKRGQRVTGYEVSLKNDVSDFFGLIAQNYLHDLDFSDGNHFLTAANVSAALDYYQGDAPYTYHLTANSDNNYQLAQFKPAFFALDIWDRIHARVGKSYEWANKDDDKTKFSNWIIPSNTDPISGTEEQALIRATRTSWDVTKTGAGQPAALLLEPIIVDTEILDVAGNYNPVTGIYQSPVNVPNGTSVIFNLSFTYKLEIINNEAETVTLVNTGAGTNTLEFFPRIAGRKNGALFGQTPIPANGNIYSTGQTIAAASSLVVCDQLVNISLSLSNFLTTDLMGLAHRLGETYSTKRWRKSGGVNASVSHKATLTGITLEIKPNAGYGYGYGQFIELNKFIPRQVKQSDFVAAIMTLNNLIVDEKRSTENKIVYVKRDEYYDAGEVKKWKLDTSREYDISFINEQTAKRHVLTYKQDDDEPNKGYQAQTGEIYGQVEYTFKSEFNRGIETTEIVFSPTPLAPTDFGAVVPLFSGINPETNIRLLYKGERLNCAPWKITEYPGSVLTISNGYVYAGHFDDPIQPNLDLNFSVCDYYFYPWLLRKTNNNMFSLNWRRHFSQIDNGKILTGFFHLTPLDIKNLKLNDKIFVLNQYWNINKVIDFDPNSGSALTKCELISVEDLAKIKTRTRFPFVLGSGGGIVNPIRAVVKKVAGQLNSLPALSDILVLGKNNFVSDNVKNAVIVGDSLEVTEDGVYTPKVIFPDGTEISSTDEIPSINIYNTDDALTGNRTVTLSGNTLTVNGTNTGTTFNSITADAVTGASTSGKGVVGTGDTGVMGTGASFGVLGLGQYAVRGVGSAYGGLFNATAVNGVGMGAEIGAGSLAARISGTSLVESVLGAGTINTTALIKMDSTTQGLLIPRMTTEQKTGITSPATGLQVIDTEYNRPEYFDGQKWTGDRVKDLVQAAQHDPAAASTVYFGQKDLLPAANDISRRVYVRGKSIIRGVDIQTRANTAGSNENWSMYIRINDTTDYLIETVGISNQTRNFTKMDLEIPLNDGDFYTIKSVTPAIWGTAPQGVSYSGSVYFA